MPVSCTRMTLTKQLIYRDVPEEFSNTYVWNNPGAADDSASYWSNLLAQLLAQEQRLFDSTVKYIEAMGWNNSDPHAGHVFRLQWATGAEPIGSFAPTVNDIAAAGDQAATIRWPSLKKSKRQKPVYFRKYFHRPFTSLDRDRLSPDYLTALANFAASGVWDLAGPFINQLDNQNSYSAGQNHASGPGTASPWVTTRTLKRRGKRPRPA